MSWNCCHWRPPSRRPCPSSLMTKASSLPTHWAVQSQWPKADSTTGHRKRRWQSSTHTPNFSARCTAMIHCARRLTDSFQEGKWCSLSACSLLSSTNLWEGMPKGGTWCSSQTQEWGAVASGKPVQAWEWAGRPCWALLLHPVSELHSAMLRCRLQ